MAAMSEQSEFIKRIGELVELAGEQENVIFDEQLEAIFPEAAKDSAKKQVLLDYLKEKKKPIRFWFRQTPW